MAKWVIEVILSAEEVDAEGFGFCESNQGGVGVAAADIGEAAYPREHLTNLVRAFPCGSESADAARRTTGDGDMFGLGAPSKGEALANFRKNFGEEEAAVGIAKRVVFEAAVCGFVVGFLARLASGVDENADDRRHVAFMDEVINDDRDA